MPAGLGFLNLDWYAAWEESYLPIESPGVSVQCIALEDETHNTHGVCPFIIKSYAGLRLFSVAGYYYPFRSIIVSKDLINSCTEALVETIQKSGIASLIRFGPAEENNPVTRNLYSTFLAQGWKCYKKDRGEQYFIKLPMEFEEYKSGLSKKMLGNLRRDTNKLAKIGDVKYIKYNAMGQDGWKQVISDCADIESRSWLDASSKGKMRVFGKEAFWTRLLKNESTSHRTSIWVMYVDKKPISYNIAIDSDGYRYGVSSQYDAAYRKYSVGLAMHFHVIEDAIKMQIKVFNMGDGDSGYKQRWGAVAGARLIDYVYFKPNIIGNTIYAGLMCKEKLEKIIASLPLKFKTLYPALQPATLMKLAKK